MKGVKKFWDVSGRVESRVQSTFALMEERCEDAEVKLATSCRLSLVDDINAV